MQNNFLEYIQKNGPEAFEKMVADTRAQYEADQKKKAEAEKAAKAREENREIVRAQLGRLMKFYYGDDMGLEPNSVADAVLRSVDELVKNTKAIAKVTPSKIEVVKDEDLPDGGHVTVLKGGFDDMTDEEIEEFWNGVHKTFFGV